MTELMVVVVIIGIMSAIAAPNMSGWLAKRDLNSQARQLASHLQLARSEAVKNNLEVRLSFNSLDPDSYSVYVSTTNAGGNRAVKELLLDDVRINDRLDVDLPSIPGGGTYTSFGFNSRGIAVRDDAGKIGPGDIDLQVGSNNNLKRTISISLGGGIQISQ